MAQQQVEEGDLNAEYADVDPSVVNDLREGKLDQAAETQPETEEEYSKRVNKRIGKEVSKRKKIETELQIWKREAEHNAAELAKFKADNLKRERERLEVETPALKKRAEAALEEGETSTYLELNEKLVENKVKMALYEDEPAPAPAATTVAAPEAAAKPIADEAQNWLDENSEWIDEDPDKFERAKQISIRLMNEKKYTANDPRLYADIDSELNSPVRSSTDQPIVNVPGGNTPPADVGGQRTHLSRTDLLKMQEYGFNPDKLSDRKNWLKANKGA